MRKKAQMSAMEIIIAATIGLVVLFSILYLFSGKVSTFNKDIEDCKTKNGSIEKTENDCLAKDGIIIGRIKDSEGKYTNEVCCMARTK
ncbi:MAG: hypothetical protein WC471_00620 [Candidatus Woesearchaeota archaeon]